MALLTVHPTEIDEGIAGEVASHTNRRNKKTPPRRQRGQGGQLGARRAVSGAPALAQRIPAGPGSGLGSGGPATGILKLHATVHRVALVRGIPRRFESFCRSCIFMRVSTKISIFATQQTEEGRNSATRTKHTSRVDAGAD